MLKPPGLWERGKREEVPNTDQSAQRNLKGRDTLWFKSFIIERQGERIEGKRERDRPWPKGDKGEREIEKKV